MMRGFCKGLALVLGGVCLIGEITAQQARTRKPTPTGTESQNRVSKSNSKDDKKTPDDSKPLQEEKTLEEWKAPAQKATPQMVTVAREFLGLLKNLDVSLNMVASASAINDTLGVKRKAQWEEYMRQMRLWLSEQEMDSEGNLVLEVLDSFMTDDLGIILFGTVNSRDVLNLDVLSIFLVKKNNQWEVVPFVSSWDNTQLSLTPEKLKELNAIERWIASKEKSYYTQFQALLEERYQKKILALKDKLQLETKSVPELVELWVKAMGAGDIDQAVAIGFIDDGPELSYIARYKQAKDYTLHLESVGEVTATGESGSLVISEALCSPMRLVQFTPVDPKKENMGQLTLMSFPYQYFAEFYGELIIESRERKSGKGYELLLPKELLSARQREMMKSYERFDHETHKDMVHKFMEEVNQSVPSAGHKTVDELLSYFVSFVDEDHSDIRDFFSMLSPSKVRQSGDTLYQFLSSSFFPVAEMMNARKVRQMEKAKLGDAFKPTMIMTDLTPDKKSIQMSYGPEGKENKITLHVEREGDSWVIIQVRE